jgi:hypothetical protein
MGDEGTNKISAGAWIAMIVGGLLVALLALGCLAFFFVGARSAPTAIPAPAPSAPAAPR